MCTEPLGLGTVSRLQQGQGGWLTAASGAGRGTAGVDSSKMTIEMLDFTLTAMGASEVLVFFIIIFSVLQFCRYGADVRD